MLVVVDGWRRTKQHHNTQVCISLISAFPPSHRPVCVADVGNKRDNHDTAPPRDSDDDEEEKEKESRLAQRAKAAGRNQRHQLAAHAMKGLVSPEVFARPSWSPAAGSDEDVGLPFEPCEEDYATAYLNRQVRVRWLVG